LGRLRLLGGVVVCVVDNFTVFCVASSLPANSTEELGCSGLERKCCQQSYNHHT
jgi:hypothetical protein